MSVPLDNAKDVLMSFFSSPSKPQYIREIAGSSRLSYERVHHYLKKLEETGVFCSVRRGKITEYTLNRRSELAHKVFSIIEMERRQEFFKKNDRLHSPFIQLTAAFLDCAKDQLKFILVFGSAARSQAKTESDIDILVVVTTAAAAKRLADATRKMSIVTGLNFSLHVINANELRKNWGKQPIYATIWLDRVLLYGEEEFWRMALEQGEPI